MAFYTLPQHLKMCIREYEKDQWQEDIGINMDNLLLSLPRDIRSDTKRYLCFGVISGVPFFENLDKQVLDAMSDNLKPVLYKEESYIVREGEPMDAMLFIMRGRLLSVTTYGGRTGFFFNSVNLKAGDFCGEELLTWSLDQSTPLFYSSNLH
ncbi:putative rmlC-like jelly roll protein [Rosa chinensis]|uniref:Putative rmlC-like jelly roll protein n=1 Tax=Rosa chinensis TaxID=74649 RepID=A0A2P6QGP5_ROSCH|nr:putative rmlC-like jelly roll protein [Rosa chinensis]